MKSNMNDLVIMVTRKFVLLLFLLVQQSCEKKQFMQYLPPNLEGVEPINQWTLIGPFKFDTLVQNPHTTFFNKDLAYFGINENDFIPEDFKKLESYNQGYFRFVTKYEFIDFTQLISDDISSFSNFYAIATIHSEIDQNAVVIADGSNSYSLWVNGIKLLEETGNVSNSKPANRFAKVNLKKGQNIVFAKVSRGTNRIAWKLFVALADAKTANALYRINYNNEFVLNPIIEMESSLMQVYLGPYQTAKILLLDTCNSIVHSENLMAQPNGIANFGFPIDRLPESFYMCKLVVDKGDTLNQNIYFGNLYRLSEKLENSIKKLPKEIRSKYDLDTGLSRQNYLFSIKDIDSTSISEMLFYQNNKIFYTDGLYNLLNASKARIPVHLVAGTFLKTFPVPTDTMVNHYLFHASSNVLNNSSMPVILIAPFHLSGTNMLTDWYIGNLTQILYDAELADQYGFALVWLYMHGSEYTPELGRLDALSVINHLKETFPQLDTNRIYLSGACEGARRALLLAAAEKDLFAGLALCTPVTLGIDPSAPINLIENYKNIPIFIRHPKYHSGTTVEHSVKFIEAAAKIGFFPEYLEVEEGTLNLFRESNKKAMEFFLKITKPAN